MTDGIEGKPGEPRASKPSLTILLAGAPRLLRRRRPRHPDRRDGIERTARPSMSATRSSTTATWSRSLRGQGRGVRRGARRGARRLRRSCSPLTACRRRCPPRRARRQLFYLDATCPLVSKVHREVERHSAAGRTVMLIGHAGHPEVVGTMGQLPAGAVRSGRDASPMLRRSSCADPATSPMSPRRRSRSTTPPTIVAALRRRFPAILGPQQGGHLLRHHQPPERGEGDRRRGRCVLVVGAPNSSNSLRLVEVARAGRLPAGGAGAARGRHRLGAARRRRDGSASRAGASAPGDPGRAGDHRLPRALRRDDREGQADRGGRLLQRCRATLRRAG